jgi:hypothetical protein
VINEAWKVELHALTLPYVKDGASRWIDCDFVIPGADEAKGEVITIGADVNEMNALLRYGLAEYPWRDENTGNKVKTSPILKLAAGDYMLNVFPAAASSTFSMTFEFR